ncbi:hypothetical protein SAMN05444673_3969 [Bacillus sp. OV166]|uniref:DUF6678 family protein n=1 Tax=Bacillus sp. OV166 TaxID=1882763 RepID=UPI000A2AECA7|nr:DUF6678 family protein [Bacillus sp. OV166]SMQ80660.1 hypothetical protein SAMN05444673_3969 [Bacillus sp. OV166]
MDFTGYQRLMNCTKWDEIWQTMSDFPEKNLWRTKDIEKGYISLWDGEWFHHFKLDGDYKTIEWLEISFDNEEIKNQLLKILQEIRVPGEILSNSIKVYGYAKIGTFVDYL